MLGVGVRWCALTLVCCINILSLMYLTLVCCINILMYGLEVKTTFVKYGPEGRGEIPVKLLYRDTCRTTLQDEERYL